MPAVLYKSFKIEALDSQNDHWFVTVKNRKLEGNLNAIKKSIDWFIDTATLIDPAEFKQLANKGKIEVVKEDYLGQSLQNDTGDSKQWYCVFNNRLIKGSKEALKKYINQNTKAK